MKTTTRIVPTLLLLALTACGGGDGGENTPPAGPLVGVRLPQTGQTSCYTSFAPPTAVGCATPGIPPGQDGAHRAGAVWPTPRFTVNDCGTPADASDDVVTDNLTGLMWTRDATLGLSTWVAALTAVGAVNRCGFTDWRLPNVNELGSLINYGEADSAVWLASQGFTAVSSDARGYWSSTSSAVTPDSAWSYSMVSGLMVERSKPGPTARSNVWPVRGGIRPAP